MNKITITPLGGLGRTGALNCMLYETAKTAILVDCGAGFVDDGYPGVDILIPNFDLLETKRDKLKAVILTHGHEDHVGGLPYLLQEICVPVYATPFTRGVITSKISEFKIKGVQLHELQPSHKIQIGDFAIEPVFIHHSIMDVVAFYITVADQKIFHCTDFKLDDSAPAQKQMDLDRFAAIGKAGVDLALLDSTNVLAEGTSESEAVIKDNLYEIFSSVPGRLIACLFSSNTYRLQSLLQCARQAGRKVALTGRSTKEYFRIAASLDRLDLAGIDFHDVEDIGQFADQEVFVIVTGSQAEPRSVLSRMSRDMFRPFKIREGDTLLMSSRMIPGNEGRILHMLNNIAQLGAH
ncbi:MAG TPA: ribonuclease J, partial [bacterium]|nr:ribonuclease J [bacterium]